MLRKDSFQNPILNSDETNAYQALILISLTVALMYLIKKFLQSRNRLSYTNPLARELVALITAVTNIWHASQENVEISHYEGQILALGPHETGYVDGAAVVSTLKGVPPHIFATDAYDSIWGVSAFLNMFQAIKIKSNVSRDAKNGKSANEEALLTAGEILKNGGSIALFPQGNMGKKGQEPHIVYPGAARLAIDNNAPIRVIRLDGIWSVNNPLIPHVICNWRIYRALLTALHPNNVRVTDCGLIDFHLKKENEHLTYDEKIREISAQLYAYFRQSGNLNTKQIHEVKVTISDKKHLLIWDNKTKRDKLVKEIAALDREKDVIEKTLQFKPG